MIILSARKYPTPRNGPLTLEQEETRRLAYAIKDIASPLRDFDTAAREMADAIILSLGHSGPRPATINSPFAIRRSLNSSQLSTMNSQLSLWLVPIPASNGNTDANARLAFHIAQHLATMAGGAATVQIAKAIYRTQPVQSQCARHKLALGPIRPSDHHFARTRKALTLRQTYFVDNVTTSGNTLEAARLALGFGAGLVSADAAPRRVQLQATLF